MTDKKPITKTKKESTMENQTQIVEINGVKLEIDSRYAKQINHYKIGDKIRVLVKEYSDYKSHLGIIVGFDNFKTLPTIIVAYLAVGYSEATIKFAFINNQSEGVEITPMVDDYIDVHKSEILSALNREIEKRQNEIKELKYKRRFFLNNFNKYFSDVDDDAE